MTLTQFDRLKYLVNNRTLIAQSEIEEMMLLLKMAKESPNQEVSGYYPKTNYYGEFDHL